MKTETCDETTVLDPETVPVRTIERTDDGYLIDADTGEVLGRADVSDTFRPQTSDEIDLVLGWRADAEARLVAAEARTAAVLANRKAIEAKERRKLANWDWRFGNDVIAFARDNLEGRKGRTLQFENGKIQFRTTQGKSDICDMEAAVNFARDHGGADLVREEIKVTDLLKVAKSAQEEGLTANLKGIVTSSGPLESVNIVTGVKGGKS